MLTLNWVILAVYGTLIGTLCCFGVHRLHLLWLSMRAPPLVSLRPPKHTPTVTVQLPIFNEPLVIERLIDAVAQLDWPLGCLQIQVLDDSNDGLTTDRAQARCAVWRTRGLRIALIRRPTRDGYKAGALEHGLHTASGQFIAIFDADFVPQPDFLRRVMPHFFSKHNAQVGMVQTRWGHLNRDENLLTQLQALLLDGHFVLEHTARYHTGRYFNFNGTAGVWDRACIAEAGGWEHDTITEDVDLSYRAQLKGWRFVYLPQVVAPAELPNTMAAFTVQQHRWAKGTIQTARKLLWRILRAPIPWRTRVEAGFHLLGPLAYPTVVLLTLSLPLSLVARENLHIQHLRWMDLATLLLTIGSVAVFYGAALRGTVDQWKRKLWQLPALLALGVGIAPGQSIAVLEGFFSDDTRFVRTPKAGDERARLPAPAGSTFRRAARWLTLSMALYLCSATVWAIALGHWLTLPFLLLCSSGLSAVSWASFRPGQGRQPRATGARPQRDAAPAAK